MAPQESSPIISESGSEEPQPETWGPEPDEPITAPGPLDEALATALDPIVSLQGSLPLDPPTMSVNVTTTTPVQNAPPNGGMRGVPPTIFDGTRSKADNFWGQFHRFKLVNRTHEAMKVPFDRVLMALTYMRGPLINDRVDQQEKNIAVQINTTKRNPYVRMTKPCGANSKLHSLTHGPILRKKQNAYDQLMHLTMNGWDVDTYIATFDRLALAAGWDSDSEGTIAKFREGLSKGIHSKALDRDWIPRTIDEWKAAARTEVARAKEKYNAGLTGNQCRNPPKTGVYLNTQTQTHAQPNNSSVVPMEVDSATSQMNFKKLTPENGRNLLRKGIASIAACKVTWPVTVQKTQIETSIQTYAKPLAITKMPIHPPKPRTLPIPQSSPELNKFVPSKKQWRMKNEQPTWMPETWDQIFGLPELEGRQHPSISSYMYSTQKNSMTIT